MIMLKKLIPLAIFSSLFTFGQEISSKKWKDLFSYHNVLKIVEDGNTLIAATENGIFYYNMVSGELKKLSKANGLHDIDITAFDYNPLTNTGLVGYRNGSMDIITPNAIQYVVDIPIAQGYNGDKKINHIYIDGHKAVVSVNYGVSIFDLRKKEFGQTAFFNLGNQYLAANESVIMDNYVYTATPQGVKTHEINVSFPVFNDWTTVLAGNFTQMEARNNLLVFGNPSQVFYGQNGNFSTVNQAFNQVKDITVHRDIFIVTDEKNLYPFTSAGATLGTVSMEEKLNTGIQANGKFFAGTQTNGIKSSSQQKIFPDGPYANRAYKMEILDDKFWISTGARKDRYNGAQPDPRNLGFYFFNGNQWVYSSYFLDTQTPTMNVVDVVPNPTNIHEVFFTNFTETQGQGIYKMKYNDANKDFDFEKLYEAPIPEKWLNRPTGLAFDEKNNLFCTMSVYSENPSTFNAGMMVYDKANDTFRGVSYKISHSTQKPLLYEGKLWVPLPRTNHLFVYDYKDTPLTFGDDKTTIISAENGLPTNSNGVISVAVDKNDDVWIGTNSGLRVLRNASESIQEANPTVENIVITQNNIAEELFRDSEINQIAVDDGNQKWVSVAGGGVYYLSADGEKVLAHFTKENSPLPTNSVTDIKIDKKTGIVYFVTFNGIVSYQGNVAEVGKGFSKIVVYPNPVVTANFRGVVTIKGLAEKTNIRIADAAGNLVHSAVARGGYYEWNLNNERGNRVASGVYFILMTNEDGTETATAKLAVVN